MNTARYGSHRGQLVLPGGESSCIEANCKSIDDVSPRQFVRIRYIKGSNVTINDETYSI
jgi:hypothetical protein